MKLNSYISTMTFEVDMKTESGFMVDIVETHTTYSAWIYHKDYGAKNLMWEVEKSRHGDKADFCNVVESVIDDYIGIYKDEHMKD